MIEFLRRLFSTATAQMPVPEPVPTPKHVTFDVAFDRLIGHEGGYVNHPRDPGGETNWGITKRTALEAGYTGAMRDLTREQAKEIYRTEYWGRARCDEYGGALAFQLFDAAVNHGIGNAIRFLQRAAGVADDGVVGPVTLAAIKKQGQSAMLMRFNAVRLNFYTNLSTWPDFGRGWTRRTAKNLEYGADDVN